MKTVFLYKSNVSCETNKEKYFAKVKQNQISPALLYIVFHMKHFFIKLIINFIKQIKPK